MDFFEHIFFILKKITIIIKRRNSPSFIIIVAHIIYKNTYIYIINEKKNKQK